ncbi:MAG: hypothetical protein AAFX56_07780 [Pseudomonadota bacterium]
MYRLLTVITACLAALSTAGAACVPDYRWTQEENSQDPEHRECTQCRDLNLHPEDFRNAMFNFVVHDSGLSSVIPAVGLGNVHSTSETFCNRYGQCATATLVIEFEPVLGIGAGVSIPVHAGISSATFSVLQSNGNTTTGTYYEAELNANMSPLLIGTGQAVPLPVAECLTNSGSAGEQPFDTSVPPVPDGDVPSTQPGSPGGLGGTPSGGGGGATCGWYAVGNEVVVVCSVGK